MSGVPVQVGPWPGGINNRTDAASLQDIEVQDCVNFIHGVDGTIIARPPITVLDPMIPALTSRLLILGSASFGSVAMLRSVVDPFSLEVTNVVFGTNETEGTYVLTGSAIWDKISDFFLPAFVVYGESVNQAFFASSPVDATDKGGVWGIGDGSITTVTDMPVGDTMCVHKDRIWIAGDPAHPSRLYYSIGTPNGNNGDWDLNAGAGFIDVEPGNGQHITCIVDYNDAIVIFKNRSTYILNYDGNITQGQLIQINNVIGAATLPHSVVAYQGMLVVFNDNNVYGYANGNFTMLNDKIIFEGDPGYVTVYSEPVSLSIFGEHVILRYYNNLYIYSFLTGGWMRWESEFPIGNMVQEVPVIGSNVDSFIVSSCEQADDTIYHMYLGWNSTDTEDFECRLITKIFDYGTPYTFKRLFWWGIDALTNLQVTGAASPVNANFTPTWDEVALNDWNFYLDKTWDTLLDVPADVVTGPLSPATGAVYRRMYKFLKGLRFRQIVFKITLNSDGTDITGPQRLLYVIPFINSKEIVVKQVS